MHPLGGVRRPVAIRIGRRGAGIRRARRLEASVLLVGIAASAAEPVRVLEVGRERGGTERGLLQAEVAIVVVVLSDAPGRAEDPAIEFRDVRLAFDDVVVLDGVSFTVRRGETKIVLGGSGSGISCSAGTRSSVPASEAG